VGSFSDAARNSVKTTAFALSLNAAKKLTKAYPIPKNLVATMKQERVTRIRLAWTSPALFPLLSIFGGKIATCRRFAENALENFGKVFPSMGQPWTNSAPLPGGDFALERLREGVKRILRTVADPAKHAERLS
jgi:glycerol-3-phosphate dehydrogenase